MSPIPNTASACVLEHTLTTCGPYRFMGEILLQEGELVLPKLVKCKEWRESGLERETTTEVGVCGVGSIFIGLTPFMLPLTDATPPLLPSLVYSRLLEPSLNCRSE